MPSRGRCGDWRMGLRWRRPWPVVAGLLAFAVGSSLDAQDHPPPGGDHPPAADSLADGHGMPAMPPSPLGIARTRGGSGTAWLPDASPMYALHGLAGPWEVMLHGNIFVQYIDEGSDRGDDQLGSINWVMAMARRRLAGGALGLRAMLSLEPVTVGECGYPDLLATGEFCEDLGPLHDRQHPHDLFMELAATYDRALTDAVAVQLYGGPVGEPALGPAAYPHRISAFPNPIAPISHHWDDATHISFGVVTAGVFGRRWKLEGSLFNGREPDEDRLDIDLGALDSFSGRVWLLPGERWALQASLGRLNEAEQHEPGEPRKDVVRATASATYHRPLARRGIWATTVVWGRNGEEDGPATHALLAESSLNLADRDIIFGRAEVVGKTGEDLALEDAALDDVVFTVGKLQLGYVRQLGPFAGLAPGLGASVSIGLVPGDLERFYGAGSPLGFAVFARLRAAPVAPRR